MRLISQDGMIDVPYDKVVIKATEHPFKTIISALFEREDYMKDIVMGCYSTESKALKVMEMLRNAYVGLPILFQNVDMNESVVDKLKEWKRDGIVLLHDNADSKIEQVNNAIFKFPDDSEVEV